jgi:CRP-like cAMP-binding protein
MTEDEIVKKVNKFFSYYKPLVYKKRETIIRADDEPMGVYFIEKGYVRNYSLSEDGKELTLNILKPGSYFPLTWVVADIPNNYYFVAMTEVVVRKAPKTDVVEKLIKLNPDIGFALSKRILVGLSGLLVRMQYLIFSDANHKVSSTMLLLAKRFGENKNSRVLIKIALTHQDIADLAGLTRETTTLEIGKLEKNGVIKRDGRFWIVKSIDKLVRVSTLYIDDKPLPYTF